MLRELYFKVWGMALLMSVASLVSIDSMADDQTDNDQWLRYPSISPDGDSIAFAYQGDIYLVSTTGGRAIPITMHPAHDSFPVWSNSGKFLAFASDRHGNYDVFLKPIAGAKAKRLTFYSGDDFPSDFSAGDDNIIFSSLRIDSAQSSQFPYTRLEELYQVSIAGGTPTQVSTIAMESARYNASGDKIIYQNKKGYENPWRKHHKSSIARDIAIYDLKTDKHQLLAKNSAEDRNPIWGHNENTLFFLSERNGSSNVWQSDLSGTQTAQITDHTLHPVRFLSQDRQGNIVYGYHGDIYYLSMAARKKGTTKGKKLAISFIQDSAGNDHQFINYQNEISEFSVSPSGDEVAYIIRGDIFVSATQYNITKRITNTAEQERSVSFSSDGRTLLYASERNGSWNLYETSIVRDEEAYFYHASLLAEKVLLANKDETFQPAYSPDNTEVAYIANRDSIKILNIASQKTRTVLPKKYNYSYSDGDQFFHWSPDGKWLAVHFFDYGRWSTDVGIVAASGDKAPVNFSRSGYGAGGQRWAEDGSALFWLSSKHGRRNHGSWGADGDIFATFMTEAAQERFNLSKDEFELINDSKETKDKQLDNKEKDDNKKEKREKKVKTIDIAFKGIADRHQRLSPYSMTLMDYRVSLETRKIYYLARFTNKIDFWQYDFSDQSTTKLAALNASNAAMKLSAEGEFAFILADGKLSKINLESGESKGINIKAGFELKPDQERQYMFEHAWRQTRDKFYLDDLHGVDWDLMKQAYQKKLSTINNNRDFAELLSEMLGELNASHTGASFRVNNKAADNTAALGFFIDYSYQGNGLKIAEILDGSPLLNRINRTQKNKDDSLAKAIRAGMVIVAIDGKKIDQHSNYYEQLNRKQGKNILLSIAEPGRLSKPFQRVVKPISIRAEFQLRYERWVKQRRELVNRLSDGKLGYVHVKSMNTASFNDVYSEVLGQNAMKQALIVDTRFNGGGWLHDDLNTLFSGQVYYQFLPRGRKIGTEPLGKWAKPSLVVVNEGNYSDAYLFPHSYKQLKLGKLVGMPVPATGTAVWWERMISRDIVFGIPQVGVLDNDGNLQENRDLIPDHIVDNDADSLANGQDKQIETAVRVLLQEVVNNKTIN